MASSVQLLTFSLLVIFSLLSQLTHSAPNPKSLILPVSKDAKTLQYLTKISIGTPRTSKTLVVDLGGRYLWLDCEKGYNSTTQKPGSCGSTTCSITKPLGFGCVDCKASPYPDCNNTCSLLPENTVTGTVTFDAPVVVDAISIPITNGPKSMPTVTVPNFIFTCTAHDHLVKGLAKGAKGMATLGRTIISIPTQLSSKFGFAKKFAICLPADSVNNGNILFGDSKYIFYPSYNKLNKSKRIDESSRFKQTRLILNPIGTNHVYMDGEKSPDYYIGVSSIMVNKKAIKIDPTLLKINVSDFGFGGSMISTVYPYGILESTIYKAFEEAVVNYFASVNVSRVGPVEPFAACFSTERMGSTPFGPNGPDIDFVLENKNVVWGMYGDNTMVSVSKDVACLAFIEGVSRHIQPSIVIGARQLQNNLLEFDLEASRLSFTETLLWDAVECQNFVGSF